MTGPQKWDGWILVSWVVSNLPLAVRITDGNCKRVSRHSRKWDDTNGKGLQAAEHMLQ